MSDYFNEQALLGNLFMYSDELIVNLRNYSFHGLPLSILLLSKVFCYRECHLTSFLLANTLDKFKLVRGDSIRYPLEDDGYPNHSWIEVDDIVIDARDGFGYKKEVFYKLNEPIVKEVYDENTIKNLKEFNNCIKEEKIGDRETLELFLKELEYFENLRPTINGERLKQEIDYYRKENPIDNYSISKEDENVLILDLENYLKSRGYFG